MIRGMAVDSVARNDNMGFNVNYSQVLPSNQLGNANATGGTATFNHSYSSQNKLNKEAQGQMSALSSIELPSSLPSGMSKNDLRANSAMLTAQNFVGSGSTTVDADVRLSHRPNATGNQHENLAIIDYSEDAIRIKKVPRLTGVTTKVAKHTRSNDVDTGVI